MAYDKSALKTSIAISAADRDLILAAGGSYGQKWFKALWPFGGTTSTGEPTLATMVQTYNLSAATDAQLEAVYKSCGVRTAALNQLTVSLAGA